MRRKPRLKDALDESLDCLSRGESISQCLYRYPQFERQLRPLLEAALQVRRMHVPEARPEAVDEGYARMMAAVRAKRRRDATQIDDRSRQRGQLAEDRSAVGTRWLVMGGIALILVLLLGFGWLWQTRQLRPLLADPVEVVVNEVNGTVLRLAAGSPSWESVSAGDSVAPGDRLQTTAGSAARLTVGREHTMALASGAEVLLIALPTKWAPTTTPLIYQISGEVRYLVDVTTRALGRGVVPVYAASSIDEKLEARSLSPNFEVQSATLVVRAERAEFEVSVGEERVTSVSVEVGDLVVAAGDQVMAVRAGQTARMALGDGALRVVETVSTPLAETPVPLTTEPATTVPSSPEGAAEPEEDATAPPPVSTPTGVPITDPSEPPEEGDGIPNPPDPPGLEDEGGVPPGLDDKGGVPPGLDDKGGVPPGLQDEGGVPPGLEDKDGVPPGLEDKDGVPPGLQDQGGVPPGQQDANDDRGGPPDTIPGPPVEPNQGQGPDRSPGAGRGRDG